MIFPSMAIIMSRHAFIEPDYHINNIIITLLLENHHPPPLLRAPFKATSSTEGQNSIKMVFESSKFPTSSQRPPKDRNVLISGIDHT